jgi:nicotinic acid mononucleotide adenylyltransferase
MQSIIKDFITHLHTHTKKQIVLNTTGVGSQCVSWLLGVSGASSTILEANIPYSMSATDMLMHPQTNHSYVSASTALHLSKRAYLRALELQTYNTFDSTVRNYVLNTMEGVVGVACTGTIKTNRPKMGDHKAHISVYHKHGYQTYDIVLEKDKRDREGEENLVSLLILNAIADCCLDASDSNTTELKKFIAETLTSVEEVKHELVANFDNVFNSSFFNGDDQIALYVPSISAELSQVDSTALFQKSLASSNGQSVLKLVYPGSFNPLHKGHAQLVVAANTILARHYPERKIVTIFELSVDNVDKDPLSESTVRHRLEQFSQDNHETQLLKQSLNFDNVCVAITRAPLFLKKAELIPGSVFLVGIDTAMRLVDPKYYNDSQEQMIQALITFKSLNCKFLVAGRLNQKDPNDHTFITLKDIDMSQLIGFKDLFIEIPSDEFRVDISSSQLRKQQ